MRDAACLGDGPEFLTLSDVRQLAICRRCTVVESCLLYACEMGATDTVYGGRRIKQQPLRVLN